MQAKLTINELYQLKWLLGGLLSLLSLWALSGLDLIGFELNFITMSIIGGALLKPGWVHSIPEAIWGKLVTPVILALVLIDFGLGFTSLIEPLMRMVILLLAYRALAPRGRREDLQMLLLSLFSIVVAGAITLSLLFAVQMLLFAPLAMIFLLIVCLLDSGNNSADHRPNWDRFSLRRLTGRVWTAVDFRVFALGGLMFAMVVVLSTGFFILIPRFDLGQSIPFMQIDTKPRSGFSERVSLDSVSKIIEDQSVALRIDVPDLTAVSSLPYWRILVLDLYQNGEFSLSEKVSKLRRYAKLRELSNWTQRQMPTQFIKGEQWTFYFEGGVSRYLPLPTLFQRLRFTKEQVIDLYGDLNVIGLDAVQKSTFSYQIDDPGWFARAPASDLENKAFDRLLSAGETEYSVDPDYPQTTLALALSKEDKTILENLNNRLTGDADELSAMEYSERVTAYLREKFRYSLAPEGNQGPGDPIVNWIESGRAGHCELFAGSFVLLARQAGYPARMVVGFVGGGWNAVENFFVVRNSNAHAWAEIYDAETDEWLRVDPTPGGGAIDPEIVMPVNFAIETGMWAWVDGLRMQWYRRVVSFDQNDQVELADSLIDVGGSLLKKLSTQVREWFSSIKKWIVHPFDSENLLKFGIILMSGFGLYSVWRALLKRSDLSLLWFRKPMALTPVRRQAARYMSQVHRRLAQSGMSETRIQTLQDLYSKLELLRFGPDVPVKLALPVFGKARKVLRKFKGFRL